MAVFVHPGARRAAFQRTSYPLGAGPLAATSVGAEAAHHVRKNWAHCT